jgi:hypothetical protein
MRRIIIFLHLLLSVSNNTAAQDLTGTWEGSSGGGEYWRIALMQIGDSCYGYSYDAGPGFCKADFVASFNIKENKFQGHATRFIESSFDHTLIETNLQYKEEEDVEFLTGVVRPRSAVLKIFTLNKGYRSKLKRISKQIDSTAFIIATARRLKKNSSLSVQNIAVGGYQGPAVQQKENIVQPKDTIAKTVTTTVKETPQPVIINEPINLTVKEKESRITQIAKTINTVADSVKIILYDDGEEDGDVVTIFDNNTVVANKLLLTKEPWQIVLPLTYNGAKHVIELMAENEGSIPPNTAYMLVLAGEERVEIKISSSKLSNAAVLVQKIP